MSKIDIVDRLRGYEGHPLAEIIKQQDAEIQSLQKKLWIARNLLHPDVMRDQVWYGMWEKWWDNE